MPKKPFRRRSFRPAKSSRRNPEQKISEDQLKHALADRLTVDELSDTIARRKEKEKPPATNP